MRSVYLGDAESKNNSFPELTQVFEIMGTP